MHPPPITSLPPPTPLGSPALAPTAVVPTLMPSWVVCAEFGLFAV
ncbi:MAG: hypothetical protein Q4B79_06260 [Moraxella sp.]|nr:hypothetical protein [Moraxella sp.]MDO4450542.1 hypothetical protein [Moraxella sp.]